MIQRILLLGLLTAGLVRAETATETTSETHALAPDGRVRVANGNGAIVIRAWDRPEVSLTVEKSAPDAEELKAIEVVVDAHPDSISIRTSQSGHRLPWGGFFSWSWGRSRGSQVRLELNVPSRARLQDVSSVNGSISIEGVLGPVEASNVNGSTSAAGLRGGEFSTVNGSIHVAVGHLDPGARLRVSSVNGSVSVVLPEDVGATVRVSTVNGRVSCAFPLVAEGGFGRGLRGVIGAGGGSVEVSSVNGSVSILRPSTAAAGGRAPSVGARLRQAASLVLVHGDGGSGGSRAMIDAADAESPARAIPIDPL